MSEWNKSCNDNRENHFDIVILSKTNGDENSKLDKFDYGKLMDNSLWDTTDIMGWWVGTLFGENQKDALPKFISSQTAECHK